MEAGTGHGRVALGMSDTLNPRVPVRTNYPNGSSDITLGGQTMYITGKNPFGTLWTKRYSLGIHNNATSDGGLTRRKRRWYAHFVKGEGWTWH